MTWSIVCDSSCDLSSTDLISTKAHFEVVPMLLQVGEREFVDDDSIETHALLQAMKEETGAVSTACPSPMAFARAFEKADCVLCFTISCNLSGTYNAAVTARDMVLEACPNKKICVIDSKATAGAMVLLARRARGLIEACWSFEDICADLRVYQASLRTCFTLENFDNLIKNGRMKPLVGTLLHTLGIHVIADATPQGTIHVADKARGEAKTFRSIARLMQASKDCRGAHVVISHCENLSAALRLKEVLQQEIPEISVELLSCRGLTTFYAMEKGLIICY